MKPSTRTPPSPDEVRARSSARSGSASGPRATGRCCRTGAGSGSAPARPGRRTARPRRRTARGRPRPGTSAAAAGGDRRPRAARSATTRSGCRPRSPARTQRGSAGSPRRRPSRSRAACPSHTWAVVALGAAFLPHSPRGGTWTMRQQEPRRVGEGFRDAIGPPFRERLGQLGRGAAARPRRARARRPAAPRDRHRPAPWRTGCSATPAPARPASTGRRARKSRAVIRCSVVRSVLPRTARRSSMSVLSSCGSKPSIRRPQRDIRIGRLLGLHPDQVLDDGLAGRSTRSSSSCRPSRVRLRARA